MSLPFDRKTNPKNVGNNPNRNRIATLANLNAEDLENSTGSEIDDDEEGQAFYAGGSVHSGQQVLGPSKKSQDNRKIVKDMFKSAISHGAEVVDKPEASRDTSKVVSFRGPGYTIGSSSGSPVVYPPPPPQEQTRPSEVVLKAWRNGFSVDDGPLRDYSDPENISFLDDVKHGRVPRELLQKLLASQGQTQGSDFHLNLEDHSNEDYVPPKKVLQAFSGVGHRLGSPTPAVSIIDSLSEGESIQDHETKARMALNVDESKPTTTIQIRLTDGTKLMIKVNHHHTVNDIRHYIVTARPQYGASVFVLMDPNSFPLKEITNDNLTVKDANLLNAVIVLRLK